MSATKIAKKLPKRVGNPKAKNTRELSWNRNLKAKEARIAEQRKRELHNAKVGSTGKQRDNQMRAKFGDKYRAAKRQGLTNEDSVADLKTV